MNPTGRLCNAVNGSTLEMKHNGAADIVGHPVAVDGPTGPYQAYRSTTNGSQVATITVPLSVPLTNRWTVSWWAKVDADELASPKKETYVWVLSSLSALKGNGYKGHGAGPNKMCLFNGGKTCNLEFPDDGWHHFAYAADGANVYCYRDGELMKTASWTKDFAFTDAFSGDVNLMSSRNQGKDAFRGCGDEFRFESECRSADWICASYLNQLAWRNGTPWQYAPHFSGISGEVPEDGTFTATAELSCRTSSKVTFFWGVSDGGDDFRKWENSVELGSFADTQSAAATVPIPSPGTRYVYRFRAVNIYGTAWSDIGYVTDPVVSKRGKRVKISVAYDGTETLKDFPLCVRIPASNSLPEDSGTVQFYDETGRDLAWEPEIWNPAGESVVWVRVPELTSQTELMMRFGGDVQNNGAWDADAVWRPDEHAGVWHFAYTGKIANPTLDSTSFGGDITAVSPQDGGFAYVTNGVAGEAFHFPKAVDRGHFYSDPNTQFNEFGSGFTFSLWLRIPDGETNDSQIFVKHESDESVGLHSKWMQYHIYYETNGKLYLTIYSNNSSIYPAFQASMAQHVKFGYNAERPDDGWHHYAFVHDGMFMRTYRDGVCLKSTFYPFVLNGGLLGGTRAQTYFGNSINQYQRAKGSIDEYRAERVGRSAAWIKACYDSQRPDSTFVTVGQTSGPGAVIVLR